MTLVVCMAHSGTEEHCRNHLPYWKAQGDVVFFSPSDLVVRMPGEKIWTHGHRGHHSVHANERFLAMLRMCAKTMHEDIVIHEYDSLCFQPMPPFPIDHLAGIPYSDTRPNRDFVGTRFIHPPLMFHRAVLFQIIDALSSQAETERFMWDRWLGLCCEKNGIPVFDLRTIGLGFSRNTIDPSDLPDARAAIAAGAICFHGVKSKQVFEALKQAGKW